MPEKQDHQEPQGNNQDPVATQLLEVATAYFQTAFDGVIRIEMEKPASSLWVDGRVSPPVLSETAPANVDSKFCLWHGSRETFLRLFLLEERRLETAYISGRLQISGDMAVMMRLEVGACDESVNAS